MDCGDTFILYSCTATLLQPSRVLCVHSDFSWSKELQVVLQERFGITSLREMQLEAINATMSKQDVILIMPTGGGKSLCFQAPALLSGEMKF